MIENDPSDPGQVPPVKPAEQPFPPGQVALQPDRSNPGYRLRMLINDQAIAPGAGPGQAQPEIMVTQAIQAPSEELAGQPTDLAQAAGQAEISNPVDDQAPAPDGGPDLVAPGRIIAKINAPLITKGWLASKYLFPVIYLLAIALAEALTVFWKPQAGMALHGAILAAVLLHATIFSKGGQQKFLATLALAPLIRMMSLMLPLLKIPFIYWYAAVGAPLFLAAFLVARVFGVKLPRLKRGTRTSSNVRSLGLQAVIALSGLGLGLLEYLILKPTPLTSALTWELIWLPALILVIFTGLLEEVIFRGLMQNTAIQALGRYGIPYVSLVFAILHIGYHSVLDIVFVFAVAVFFSIVVAKTGSLFGVTVAHGLTNISLFLVIPFVWHFPASPVVASTNLFPSGGPATPQAVQSLPLPPAAPTQVAPYSEVALIVRARTPVRQGPGSNYQIACYVDAGTQFTITSRNIDSTWLRVKFAQGQSCYRMIDIYRVDMIPDPALLYWITPSTGAISGDLSGVATITPTATSTPTRLVPTSTRTPTATRRSSAIPSTGTPTPSNVPLRTRTPLPTITPILTATPFHPTALLPTHTYLVPFPTPTPSPAPIASTTPSPVPFATLTPTPAPFETPTDTPPPSGTP